MTLPDPQQARAAFARGYAEAVDEQLATAFDGGRRAP